MNVFTRALAGILGGLVVVLGVVTLLGNTVLAGTPVMDALGAGAANAASTPSRHTAARVPPT